MLHDWRNLKGSESHTRYPLLDRQPLCRDVRKKWLAWRKRQFRHGETNREAERRESSWHDTAVTGKTAQNDSWMRQIAHS